ncbi:MAG: family efflux transporter, subunit [Chthonomonadaceae bacterium]|nr:family efflux transporter, subunit [Chthonomonadaceae bacterium]
MRNPKLVRALASGLLLLSLLGGCRKKAAESGADPPADAASTEPTVVECAMATTRSMETVIAAQGTLAPGQGAVARVAPSTPGRLLSVRVREGDRVTAGQVVATLDNRPQQAQAQSARAALSVSRAQSQEAQMAARAAATDQGNSVKVAHLAVDAARLDRANAVQQAQNALLAAQTDLRKTQAGARPQEIAQADQAVRQAQSTHDRAAIELQRSQKLLSIGVAATRQVDDAQTALDIANSTLESAKQAAALVKAGARAEDLQAAQLRVDGAQELLRQAQKSGDAKVQQAQAALTQAQESVGQVAVKQQDARAFAQTVAQKQADLAAAQSSANYAEVHAPLSGIVTRRALNPGDMADVTNPIVEISDVRSLNLIANLSAADGTKLRAGMPARITSPDIPGKTFPGSVLSVGQVDPQTNLLAVRIVVYNAGSSLRVGGYALSEVVLKTDPHAVVVPKQAVLAHDGKSVVFVVGKDDVAHQTEVTLGPERNGFVEVTEGLKPDTRIVNLGGYELADGAKVKEAEKKDPDKKDAAKE